MNPALATLSTLFTPAGPKMSFKGEGDAVLLDALVVQSAKKTVHDSQLKERALVPFFDGDSCATTFEPLQRRGAKSPFQQVNHGLKRNAGDRSGGNLAAAAGSPPKREGRRGGGKPVPARRSGGGSASDSEASTAGSFQRGGSGGVSSPAPAARGPRKHDAPRRSPSPPHKRGELAPAADKFAGPAFCNSPTPDSLPIPTTSLLMQQAADSLRSRLML